MLIIDPIYLPKVIHTITNAVSRMFVGIFTNQT